MVDRNLFFKTASIEKFSSTLQPIIGNII